MPRRPSPQLLLEGLGTIPRCPAHLVCLSHEGLPILPRDQVRPLLLSSLTTPLLCPSLSPSFFICQVEESPTPAPAMPLGTQRCLPSIENLALGQNLKGLMATLSPHNRFTAIQTGWCWTREEGGREAWRQKDPPPSPPCREEPQLKSTGCSVGGCGRPPAGSNVTASVNLRK